MKGLSRKKLLYSFLKAHLQGRIAVDELMKDYTSFCVGGRVDLLIEPRGIDDLQLVLPELARMNVRTYIVGRGSNLLVSDRGLPGVVIKIGSNLDYIERWDSRLVVGGGTSLSRLVKYCVREGLSGLEFAAGIPGTVGGAVCMNAGGHHGCMAEVLKQCRIVDAQGDTVDLSRQKLNFGYRYSSIKDSGRVISEVELHLAPGSRTAINERVQQILSERRESQPLSRPNAGSIFKNPPQDAAGRLIEEIGAKGRSRGGACVSELHANFIVNSDSASARDIYELMCEVQLEVKKRFGVELEPEIQLWGF